jgi:hypothetical protein
MTEYERKNQEHFEAAQKELDRKNESFYDNQPKEDQDKYTAIKEALDSLVKAGVDDAFLFVGQNTPNGHYEHVHYNTLQPFIQYDKNGMVTIKEQNRCRKAHASLAYGINKFYTRFTGSENLDAGNKLLMEGSYHYWNYVANGEDFPEIKEDE